MKSCRIVTTCCLLMLSVIISRGASADLASDVRHLQQHWAQINYHLTGKTQLTDFELLINDADNITRHYPEAAAAWLWSGIIKSSYAGARGGIGALKIANTAKADFEHALKLEADTLTSSILTSLGTLYFKVPGWPLSFGDDDKAGELLREAVAISPDDIDTNYFYGVYLLDQQRYQQAEQFLLKAQAAPKRPDRALADAERQKEILSALAKVRVQRDQ